MKYPGGTFPLVRLWSELRTIPKETLRKPLEIIAFLSKLIRISIYHILTDTMDIMFMKTPIIRSTLAQIIQERQQDFLREEIAKLIRKDGLITLISIIILLGRLIKTIV